MGYNKKLAERVHAVVAGRDDIREKPMFGGLCLLAHGNMFAGIQGEILMARVGPERHDEALERPHARIMDFSGRPMRGYVYVDPPGIASEAQLRGWIELRTYADRSLVAAVESVDRPAVVPPDQEVRDGLHGQS